MQQPPEITLADLRENLQNHLAAHPERFGATPVRPAEAPEVVIAGISDWVVRLARRYALAQILARRELVISAAMEVFENVVEWDIPGVGPEAEKRIDKLMRDALRTMLNGAFDLIEKVLED